MSGFMAPTVEEILAWIATIAPSPRRIASRGPSTPIERDAVVGERLAAAWLETRGYRIAASNLHLGHDEADLVVIAPGGPPHMLAIVEVKTSRDAGAPAHRRIDAGKRQRMIRFAKRLLASDALCDAFIRFDAVSVDLSRDPPGIEHLPSCFEAAWPTDRRRGGR